MHTVYCVLCNVYVYEYKYMYSITHIAYLYNYAEKGMEARQPERREPERLAADAAQSSPGVS